MEAMRSLARLFAICLSLALLGGVMAHEVVSARMSIDMAASAFQEQQDDICPACGAEDEEAVVCDLDCTAPLLFAQTTLPPLPERPSVGHVQLVDALIEARRPGFDPAPPRTSILS